MSQFQEEYNNLFLIKCEDCTITPSKWKDVSYARSIFSAKRFLISGAIEYLRLQNQDSEQIKPFLYDVKVNSLEPGIYAIYGTAAMRPDIINIEKVEKGWTGGKFRTLLAKYTISTVTLGKSLKTVLEEAEKKKDDDNNNDEDDVPNPPPLPEPIVPRKFPKLNNEDKLDEPEPYLRNPKPLGDCSTFELLIRELTEEIHERRKRRYKERLEKIENDKENKEVTKKEQSKN